MSRRSERRRSESSLRHEVWRAFVLGTVPLVLAAAGVWLTPLRDVVARWIWSEQASLTVILPRVVYVGDEFEVRVLADPTSPVAVSAGILELKPANELVVSLSGTNHVDVPATPNPSVLNKAAPARFVAVGSGMSGITARLRTRNGRYEMSEPVEIRSRDADGTPTRRNFTGRWAVSVGPYRGEMEISETGATLNGRYSLDDGTRGVVDGIRDGTVFHATFYRGNSPSKWIVVAEASASDEYLEVKGKASLYSVDGRGSRTSGDAHPFSAIARLGK